MNQFLVAFIVLAVISFAGAAHYSHFTTSHQNVYHHSGHPIFIKQQAYLQPRDYSYKYGVTDLHTGDVKSQHETRKGGVVVGQYSVAEPDGTLRIVEYTADPHSGFNAKVYKTGHAVHQPAVAHQPVLLPAAHHSYVHGHY